MKLLIPIVVCIAALAVLYFWWKSTYAPVPDKHETVGPFTIAVHANGDSSVRYRNQELSVTVHGFDGDVVQTRFNSIVTFPAAEPVVVLNAGDPNNTSYFYLAREIGGEAKIELLTESSADISADWIDAKPGGVRDITIRRKDLPAGGRWLLLGAHCVLDAKTLAVYRITAQPGASVNQFKPPICMAPDECSFVRFGYGFESESPPRMIVYGFVDDVIETVPIDPQRMRFNEWEEIDEAWLLHHFEWRSAGGRDHLAERASFDVMPHRGVRPVDQHGNPPYREYNLRPVKPEMFETMIAFVEKEFGGKRQPPSPGGSVSVDVGGRMVHLLIHDEQVGLYMDRYTDSSLVTEIGDRFDAALRTKIYDDLFL